MARCKACSSSHIESDSATGTSYCQDCGVVFEENAIVAEITFGETGSGAAMVQGSYVGAGSARARMSGVHGRNMGGESQEQTMENGRRRILQVASAMHLPETIAERAQRYFKLALGTGFVKGRKSLYVVATCLYVACRQRKTSHMLIDFSDMLQVNVFSLGRTYLDFINDCHISKADLELIDPATYIHRFASLLEFGDETSRVASDAVRLVRRFSSDWMVFGRRPSGICGAALLLAARMNNFRRSVQEIIQVVKIADTTIQKRLEEFKQTPSAALTVHDFRNIDLQDQMDPPAFYQAKLREEKLAKKRRRDEDGESGSESDDASDDEERPRKKAKKKKGRRAKSKRKGKERADSEQDASGSDEEEAADEGDKSSKKKKKKKKDKVKKRKSKRKKDAEGDDNARKSVEPPAPAPPAPDAPAADAPVVQDKTDEHDSDLDAPGSPVLEIDPELLQEDASRFAAAPSATPVVASSSSSATVPPSTQSLATAPADTQATAVDNSTLVPAASSSARFSPSAPLPPRFSPPATSPAPKSPAGRTPLFLPGTPEPDINPDVVVEQVSMPGHLRDAVRDSSPDATLQDPNTAEDDELDKMLAEQVNDVLSTEKSATELSIALDEAEASRSVAVDDELLGLDEDELDALILTPEEVHLKERIWVEINRDYLVNLAAKMAVESGSAEATKRKPRKKGQGNKPRDSTNPMGTSPADAAHKLAQKKVSKKINYNAWSTLFARAPSEGKKFNPAGKRMYTMDGEKTDEMMEIEEDAAGMGVGSGRRLVADDDKDDGDKDDEDYYQDTSMAMAVGLPSRANDDKDDDNFGYEEDMWG